MSILLITILALLAICIGVGIGIWLQRPTKPLPAEAPVGTVLVSNATKREFVVAPPPELRPGRPKHTTVRHGAISVAWPTKTVNDHFKTK